jgi:DNA modification methylase
MEQLNLFYGEKTKTDLNFNRQRDESLDFKGIPASRGIYSIHPYPAMFHFMLVRKFLKEFSKEGDLVFDPFCGSGVSAGECLKLSRNFVGYDINPLAILIAKVRTTPQNIEELEKNLEKILKTKVKNFDVPDFHNIRYWFDDDVIEELARLREAIFRIEKEKVQDFFKVAFSETVRKVSNADPNEFKLLKRKKGENSRNVKEFFRSISKRNIQSILEISNLKSSSKIILEQRNILDGIPLEDESVDFVITSPPYGDSKTTVAYEQFSKLSLKWLGIDDKFEKNLLGAKIRKPADKENLPSDVLYDCVFQIEREDEKRAREVISFYYDLFLAIKEISRKVKGKGFVVFVVGNRKVKGIELPTDKICADFFISFGFNHIKTFVREISNKRMPDKNSPSNLPGRKSDTMKYEFVVVLKKKG